MAFSPRKLARDGQGYFCARIVVGDRRWYLNQLPRVVQLANYSARMQRAGVPDKVRLKVLRRFRAWPWELRKEMAALVEDMRCAV